MFDNASRSSFPGPDDPALPLSARADSEIAAKFEVAAGATRLVRLFEQGSLRLRQPRRRDLREAVLVNTGGGITGGDRLKVELALATGAAAVFTSQAAEKIYRTDGPPARIEVLLDLADNARLDWLPQETILFDAAAAERSLDADVAGGAELTLLESLVLGRIARGEQVRTSRWRDRWRIRRAGRLVLAEDVRLAGDIAAWMDRSAAGNGARAIATLVHVSDDAEARLEGVRQAIADAPFACGASAWNGVLVVRFAALEPHLLRDVAMRAVTAVTGTPMPRAWGC